MRRSMIRTGLVGPAIGALTVGLSAGLCASVAVSSTAARAAAPPSSIRPIDAAGLKQELAKRRGKLVLVNVWATWCPPCVASYPEIVKASRADAARGFDVISVSVDDLNNLRSKVAPFLRKQRPGFATFIKRPGGDERFMAEIDPKWQGDLPADVLFGPDGKRAASFTGEANFGKVRRRIEQELGRMRRRTASTRR